MNGEFLSWATLGTFAGAAAAVSLLTQILKQFFEELDPKWIALILSLLVCLGVQIVDGDYAPATFVMSALNALVVAGTSVGVFEGLVKPFTAKEDE